MEQIVIGPDHPDYEYWCKRQDNAKAAIERLKLTQWLATCFIVAFVFAFAGFIVGVRFERAFAQSAQGQP